MNKSDRIKRAVAFYFSVVLFFSLLPIFLSYSLGYKIDYVALKIYKTGIIYINSQPSGASVYINGRKYKNTTPTQIEKLRPASYRVEVRLENYYPWERNLTVKPNMVTKADRIVLFPIAQDRKKLVNQEISDFIISDKGIIYYMGKYGLFRSGMDGSSIKKLSSYSSWPGRIIGKKFSPDGNKFFYFTQWTLSVAYLNPDKAVLKDNETARIEEVLASEDSVIDAFWYSDSGYIIIVTERDIKVAELRGEKMRNIVSLYRFVNKPQSIYYDDNNDSLYFIDEGYMRKLDLRQKFFDNLIQMLRRKDIENGA